MKYNIETVIRTVEDLRLGRKLDAAIDYGPHATTNAGSVAAFVSNPNATPSSNAEMIGIIDGKAFGSMRTLPMKMLADGVVYETSANPDMRVEEKFRKTGFAFDLGDFGAGSSRDRITLDFYVSRKARKLASMRGAKLFAIKQFVTVRDSSILLKGRLNKVIAPPVCWFVDTLFFFYRCLIGVWLAFKTVGWQFELADDEGSLSDFAALVASDRHRFRHVEDEKFLKWILTNDFYGVAGKNKHLWRVTRKGSTIGFVMMRQTPSGLGRIIDWQMMPDAEKLLPVMLVSAMYRLVKSTRAVILPISATDRDAVAYLSWHCPRVPDQVAVVSAGDGPLNNHGGWDDPSNWRIRPTMGDSCLY